MFNQVQLIGRLGADPEIKSLRDGKQVANMRLATSEKWKDKHSGERKEKTEWHQVVCWNENLIGIIEQYVRKGSLVQVVGKLQTREWEKNGEKRYSTEVVMQGFDAKITLLGGRDDSGGGGGGSSSRGGSTSQSRSRADDLDDEIPF